MNPFWLLLPIASVISLPTEYDDRHSVHCELPNEFWSQHFGPDFQHAVHFDLKQTDLIDTGNIVDKHLPESKDGNRKRSAYTIHKPHTTEQENRAMGSSMRVHLLQPDEIEALEKEMVNYAKGNKMAESPVVVNLPASEGSTTKNNDHETPVVLSVPPVVYHSNPNMVQPYNLESTKNAWSHNNKYSSFDNKRQYSYDKTQSTYEYEGQPSHGDERQISYESNNLATYESNKPSYEEGGQASYDDRMNSTHEGKSQQLYGDAQDAKDGNKDETV